MMSLSATAALWFLPFCLPLAFWVIWSDLKFMRIPNAAVLAMLAVFLVVGPLALPLEVWAWRWLHFAGVLAFGFLLSTAGLIGAGDAKFAASMAPFVAWGDVAMFLPLFAAVLLAGFATHRAFRRFAFMRRTTPDWASWTRPDFPMGLALGGTLVFYLILASQLGR